MILCLIVPRPYIVIVLAYKQVIIATPLKQLEIDLGLLLMSSVHFEASLIYPYRKDLMPPSTSYCP